MSDEFERPKTFDRATLLRRGAAVGGAFAAAGWLPTLAGARRSSVTLNLVAYSTPKPVLTKLISAFQATPDGSGVSFTTSYGGSSAQAAAVVAGQPADVVIFSTGTDMNLLVDHGLVDPKWNRQSYNGVVWNSVVVFGLRDGNPKHIKTWNDLVKPGRRRPDPESVHGRHRQVGHPDAVRGRAAPRQDRRAGAGVHQDALQPRRVPGLLGQQRHEHVHLGEGRRARHLRERGDQREASRT